MGFRGANPTTIKNATAPNKMGYKKEKSRF
jgi:hypothetical protein